MEFTNTWFQGVCPAWEQLLPIYKPAKILEIGSFEGQATCWLMQFCSRWHPLEIHCVDTWEGGVEHHAGGAYEVDMVAVEQRFRRNVEEAARSLSHGVELRLHKTISADALVNLLHQGYSDYFDLIYVDGSHLAADVLQDAVLGFRLLRRGGLLIFDDYLWIGDPNAPVDPYAIPKVAIDAFINLYRPRLRLLQASNLQVYVLKN